jgi:hypothetical protein
MPRQTQFTPAAKALARQWLGAKFSPAQLAAAFGAPANAHVTFSVDTSGRLKGVVQHMLVVAQERVLFRDQHGDLVIRNQYLEKQPFAPKDTGIRLFQIQVEAAQKLGIKRITTIGAGDAEDGKYIGYYLMARYGFDAPLEDRDLIFLRKLFPTARTLNELILAGGKDWLREFGREKEMIFDLAPDSSMMAVFRAYLAELRFQRRL